MEDRARVPGPREGRKVAREAECHGARKSECPVRCQGADQAAGERAESQGDTRREVDTVDRRIDRHAGWRTGRKAASSL